MDLRTAPQKVRGSPLAKNIQSDADRQSNQSGALRSHDRPQSPQHPQSPISSQGQLTAPSPAWAKEGPPLALSLPLPYLLLFLIYINYLSPIIHPAVPTVICE